MSAHGGMRIWTIYQISFRRVQMKVRFAAAILVGLFAGALAMAGDGSWTGYITDSKCGAKAAHEGAAECTVKCVKEGAKYVFVNDVDNKVYAIDDQDKVAAHAGHHVTIKGSVEGDNLKVTSVDMAPAKSK
jgi:hypothetical protein